MPRDYTGMQKHMVAQSNKIRSRTVAKDVYYTPKSVVDIHLAQILPYVKPDYIILEPCRGKGAYYDEFAKVFPTSQYEWCEISDDKDYFEYTGSPDVIVTNPPFSILDKFIDKTIELNPRIFSLLLMQFAVSPRRLEKLNNAGYFIVEYLLLRINKWFGVSCIVTFSREVTQNLQGFGFDCQKHVLEL